MNKVISKIPTHHTLGSLRNFGLTVTAHGNGAYTGELTFETEEEAKAHLRSRADMLAENEEEQNEMYADIENGYLRYDAATASIEEVDENEED